MILNLKILQKIVLQKILNEDELCDIQIRKTKQIKHKSSCFSMYFSTSIDDNF